MRQQRHTAFYLNISISFTLNHILLYYLFFCFFFCFCFCAKVPAAEYSFNVQNPDVLLGNVGDMRRTICDIPICGRFNKISKFDTVFTWTVLHYCSVKQKSQKKYRTSMKQVPIRFNLTFTCPIYEKSTLSNH